MIVYRDDQTGELAIDLWRQLQSVEVRPEALSHEQLRELLVDVGQLEAAITDERPDASVADAYRELSDGVGLLFAHSWQNNRGGMRRAAGEVANAIRRCLHLPPGPLLRCKNPEGYAHYALYPEQYLEAAALFERQLQARCAVCIGIRSIGTSLSSAVSGALRAKGREIRSFTVRPDGHPFSRELRFDPTVEAKLRSLADAHFCVVDEGPGLSGSSFASVATALSAIGIPDERITFFPSWIPEGPQLLSEEGRRRWARHKKYCRSFEETWHPISRLLPGASAAEVTEWSGGQWRHKMQAAGDGPAVQPQHEARKYLVTTEGRRLLFKFSGLGRLGERKLIRGQQLAEEGFGPPVHQIRNGFLCSSVVSGRAIRGVSRTGEKRIAEYLRFIRERFPHDQPVSFDRIQKMIEVNTSEALGADWARLASQLHSLRSLIDGRAATRIDGRMLPHKWLQTRNGLVKVDGLDHWQDHFFPGAQDIAWDLAAIAVEFREGDSDRILRNYSEISGDRSFERRLTYYGIAYLAYRIGYSHFAEHSLAGSPDGLRWSTESHHYRAKLRDALQRVSGGIRISA